jgi:hypothetical protein
LNRCTRFCKPLHNHSATGPPYTSPVLIYEDVGAVNHPHEMPV